MKNMLNILTAFLLVCPVFSCDDTKEYPWNDAWNNVEQPEQPETPENPQEPQQPEQPVEPEQPENPEQPEQPVEPEKPVEPEQPEQPQAPQISGQENWNDVSSSYAGLPEYIKIYKSKDQLMGKKSIAYLAVADMTKAEWDVWSVKIKDGALTEQTNDSFKTPSQVYSDKKSAVIINGGYFYYSGSNRYTASLAVSNNEILAYNIGYEYKDGATLLPARAVFREATDGTFDACWTYVNWDKKHYMYQKPSDDPSKKPTADYPEGGMEFEAKNAIGGGPLLINDGKYVNSYVQEVFYGINPDTDQPRTAVGITSNGLMVYFVCEGRSMTAGVKGLTTGDVANVLLQVGCVEAINLDGGGSSCMLINGKETIKVSDGSQRSVASTLMLK